MSTLKQRIYRVNKYLDMETLYLWLHPTSYGIAANKQVSCHVHGRDNTPSARIYQNKYLYCFVCKKTYTPFNYVLEYNGVSFSDISSVYDLVEQIEIKFDLTQYELEDIEDSPNTIEEREEDDEDIKKLFRSKWLELNEIFIQNPNLKDGFKFLDYIISKCNKNNMYKKGLEELKKVKERFNI